MTVPEERSVAILIGKIDTGMTFDKAPSGNLLQNHSQETIKYILPLWTWRILVYISVCRGNDLHEIMELVYEILNRMGTILLVVAIYITRSFTR